MATVGGMFEDIPPLDESLAVLKDRLKKILRGDWRPVEMPTPSAPLYPARGLQPGVHYPATPQDRNFAGLSPQAAALARGQNPYEQHTVAAPTFQQQQRAHPRPPDTDPMALARQRMRGLSQTLGITGTPTPAPAPAPAASPAPAPTVAASPSSNIPPISDYPYEPLYAPINGAVEHINALAKLIKVSKDSPPSNPSTTQPVSAPVPASANTAVSTLGKLLGQGSVREEMPGLANPDQAPPAVSAPVPYVRPPNGGRASAILPAGWPMPSYATPMPGGGFTATGDQIAANAPPGANAPGPAFAATGTQPIPQGKLLSMNSGALYTVPESAAPLPKRDAVGKLQNMTNNLRTVLDTNSTPQEKAAAMVALESARSLSPNLMKIISQGLDLAGKKELLGINQTGQQKVAASNKAADLERTRLTLANQVAIASDRTNVQAVHYANADKIAAAAQRDTEAWHKANSTLNVTKAENQQNMADISEYGKVMSTIADLERALGNVTAAKVKALAQGESTETETKDGKPTGAGKITTFKPLNPDVESLTNRETSLSKQIEEIGKRAATLSAALARRGFRTTAGTETSAPGPAVGQTQAPPAPTTGQGPDLGREYNPGMTPPVTGQTQAPVAPMTPPVQDVASPVVQPAPSAATPAQSEGGAPPAPADPKQRQVGKWYVGPSGRVGRWTGTAWEVQ